MHLFQAYFTLTWILNLVLLLGMIVALVDAAIRPGAAYVAAGKRTKQLWVLVIAAGTAIAFIGGVVSLFGLIGLVASIVYWVDVRPAVRSIGGSGGGTHQGPYGPW